MAKETVKQIRDAERAGEEQIELSRQRAKMIITNGSGKGELILNDAKRELKAYEQKAAADTAYAVKVQTARAVRAADVLCAKLEKRAERNLDAACAVVMEILL